MEINWKIINIFITANAVVVMGLIKLELSMCCSRKVNPKILINFRQVHKVLVKSLPLKITLQKNNILFIIDHINTIYSVH
jgi:hypothetical protein